MLDAKFIYITIFLSATSIALSTFSLRVGAIAGAFLFGFAALLQYGSEQGDRFKKL